MAYEATPIEPTWEMAAKVWWAFIWRSAIFSVLIGVVVGLVIGFFASILGISAGFLMSVSSIIGLALGIGVSIWAMKMILAKKFKTFQVVLIQTK